MDPHPLARKWPPQCCVPAFVDAALHTFGYSVDAPSTLPLRLGVHVGPLDQNPLSLPVTDDPANVGLNANVASERINSLFAEMGAPLAFRHIALNEVIFGASDVLVEEALVRNVVVGVGPSYASLDDTAPAEARHVLRLTHFERGLASLHDDSGERPRRQFELGWEQVEIAIRAGAGGIWLVGPPQTLDFDVAPKFLP